MVNLEKLSLFNLLDIQIMKQLKLIILNKIKNKTLSYIFILISRPLLLCSIIIIIYILLFLYFFADPVLCDDDSLTLWDQIKSDVECLNKAKETAAQDLDNWNKAFDKCKNYSDLLEEYAKCAYKSNDVIHELYVKEMYQHAKAKDLLIKAYKSEKALNKIDPSYARIITKELKKGFGDVPRCSKTIYNKRPLFRS